MKYNSRCRVSEYNKRIREIIKDEVDKHKRAERNNNYVFSEDKPVDSAFKRLGSSQGYEAWYQLFTEGDDTLLYEWYKRNKPEHKNFLIYMI